MQNKAIESIKEKIVEALSQEECNCEQKNEDSNKSRHANESRQTNQFANTNENGQTNQFANTNESRHTNQFANTNESRHTNQFTNTNENIKHDTIQNTCNEQELEETTENSDVSELNGKNQNFGKFKTPDELMRAYQELEKEFTRRSQKLSKIENELNEAKAPYAPSENEWKVTVDKFFENTPSARPFAKDIAREIMQNPDLKNNANCLSFALTRVLVEKFQTPEQMLKNGQFLNDYVLQSETVKSAVINNYLKGLKDGLPPATLSSCGEVSLLAMKKPKSLEEAGILFLKNNK